MTGRDKGRSFGNLSDKHAPMSRIADKHPVARRYNDLTEIRDMRRTTIRGDGLTVAQVQQAA